MRKVVTSAFIAAAGWASASAADIYHRETIPDFRAVSIAYDAVMCGIWIANESREVILLSTVGKELRRFETGLRSVRSLTVEDDGILIANGWGEFQRLDREGQSIDTPFSLSATLYDTEGLHRDSDGSFLVVEDDPSRLMRIAPDGTVLMELFGNSFDPPMTEPQGVTRDPYSGNILVVDDNEGLNSLFELAPDGRVLSVSPLSQYGRDAEGVALQPETGTLYVGFDDGRALAVFDWLPTEITIDTPLERGPDCAYS